MQRNPDRHRTHRDPSPRHGAGLFASVLVTTLGMAVVMPGLLLQGVATRPRTGEADLDEAAPEPIVAGQDGPMPAQETVARNGAAAVAPVAGTDGETGAGNQNDAAASLPGDGNADQGVRLNRNGKPRPDRSELSQSERIARRRERLEQKAAGGNGRPRVAARAEDGAETAPGGPDVAAAAEPDAPSTALATVEPGTVVPAEAPESGVATGTAPGEAAAAVELVPAGPVTFEEVQAAHHQAAVAFRDVKKSLDAAYALIGRLNVDRYKAEYELAELKGLPLPERPPDRAWKSTVKPVAPPEAKRVKRTRRDEESEQDQIDEAEVKSLARRRQRMVLIGLAALGVFIIIYRVSGWGWFPDLTDRQAMTQIAGFGILMQAFFLIFFLFRLGTMTGRGKSWLFPTAEQEAYKRRRKRMRGH